MFLLFGVIARRGAAAGMGGDPVPQAMVITGIVVAFSATALAVALLLRLFQATGEATLSADAPSRPDRAREPGADPRTRRAASCSCWQSSCRRPAWCWRWRSAGATPSASPWRRCRPGSPSPSRSSPASGSRGPRCCTCVGGWAPPLGIALRADGLSAIMLVTTALVIGAIGLFARDGFATPAGAPEARAPLAFWTLLMGVWAGLNAVWLGGDLFTLYVALELLTFGAVPLVCLDGRAETLAAALRYLLFALLGSVLYLLGAALLYGGYGTLDIVLLSGLVRAEPVVWVAAALMTTGLIAKTALFPLHLWLPPAHAGAPAAASALLSALVVKGSFILIVRLWFDAMPGLLNQAAAQMLAALGAAAIVFGSVLALRQARLKLLIAYSTIAQIGYLFFLFPLASAPLAVASADGRSGTASPGPAACCSSSPTPLPRPPCSWPPG